MFENDFLRDAVYSSRINAASAERFLNIIRPYVKIDNEYCSSKFREIIKNIDCDLKFEKWLRHAISLDIPIILDALEHLRKDDMNIQMSLRDDLEFYIHTLSKIGIKFSPPELHLMKEFPWPYERIDGWAVNIDYVDQKEFGIPRGIYLHEKYLARRFSSTILAHELVHCAIAECKKMDHVRGIEEGIADLMSLVLSSKLIGRNVAENIIFNTRFEWPIDDFWANYQVAIRQAALVYLQHGVRGLVQLIRTAQQKGRKKLYLAENAIIRGIMPIKTKSFKRRNEINTILRFLAYPHSLVVSPLAYHVARTACVGDSVNSLAIRLKTTNAEIKCALKELQDRHYIVLVVNNRILSTAGQYLINSKALRYEIPEV
jgi:hypothetical protein